MLRLAWLLSACGDPTDTAPPPDSAPWVEPGCGEVFRAGVEGLFPEKPKLNTLYHLFRRSGLVPEDWRRAWEGEIPFLWNPNRVSV